MIFFKFVLEKDRDYSESSSDVERDLQIKKSDPKFPDINDPDCPDFRLDRTGPRRDFIRTLLTSEDSEEEMDIKVVISINRRYCINQGSQTQSVSRAT